ncbi:MAG TPA: (Fe-S)-binding protein [Fimbriimonas sp.]|nr:(Fe-S)-binding protein [Fimbriimonas sp.]
MSSIIDHFHHPLNSLDDLTTRCIRCGFCLESCPTFVVTGSELESPRGRIYLARSASEGKLDWVEDVSPHMERCLGCRACETACPSGVKYGEILEIARDTIEHRRRDLPKTILLESTTKPGLLKAQIALSRILPGNKVPHLFSKWISGCAPEAEMPVPQKTADLPELDESNLPAVKGEVYLLEGCAMRVLFPRVHQATRRLLRRIGYVVRETDQGCCGAMHAHNGHLDEARRLGTNLIKAMPDDLPVIVNSAGCGSTMKEYGELLSPPLPSEGEGSAVRDFACRVKDASQFLLANGLLEALADAPGLATTATYHDACHLAHGQRITSEPRELLEAIPSLKLVPLPESDMCCGSAGIYNITEPTLARTLLDRKYANVATTGANIVATGNPGCHAWIAQAAREHGDEVLVLHTMELLEAAFVGLKPFSDPKP